jgi:hypothetical protein
MEARGGVLAVASLGAIQALGGARLAGAEGLALAAGWLVAANTAGSVVGVAAAALGAASRRARVQPLGPAPARLDGTGGERDRGPDPWLPS